MMIAKPGDPMPLVVVVPGPVDQECRVDSLQSLAEYLAPNPEHPIRKFADHLLRDYPNRVISHIMVRPEKEWFPNGQLHSAVTKFPSVQNVIAQFKAMTDEERSEVIRVLMADSDPALMDMARNPLHLVTR